MIESVPRSNLTPVMRIGSDNTRSAELSVIIVTPDRYETVRTTIRCLRAQTVRERLELLIVAPSVKELELDAAEMEDFLQVRVVEVGAIRSTAAARAAGVRHASASVVAFAEEHSYPAPGWAAALIEAHRQPWAAVGPVMANANPVPAISWANLFLHFAPWVEPADPGITENLPWHNTSYKRAVLLDYGPELEAMLEVEGILHRDLRVRGYQLYLEPKAKTCHLNITRPSSYAKEQFYGGRMFAAARGRRWSGLRRLLYTGGAPLIFLVRLRRVLHEIRRSGRQRDLLPGVLPTLVPGLALHVIGEMMGYAFGAGDALQRFSEFELHKGRHT
jgi:glycosyltransferase involved in cell wall biosynthesis